MKNFTIQLAKKAGKEINKRFNKDRIIKVKKKSQILTQADLIADKIIVTGLKKKFPNHGILSEESGLQKNKACPPKLERSESVGESDYLWVIDPLDGTTNYAIGSPLFGVGISLFFKDQPILAVAYMPAMNELYFAEKGKGAYLNNKKIKVSNTKTVDTSLLTYCHGSAPKDIKRGMKVYQKIKLNGLDCRQLGSAAVEFAFVAAGRTESILLPGAHVWDVGPGTLIVREAGGRVTDFQGKDWNLKSKDVVASNGKIHNQLLRLLRNI